MRLITLAIAALLCLTAAQTCGDDNSLTKAPDVVVAVGQDTQPLAVIDGPTESPAGELVEFDAGGSTGAGYDWDVSGPHNTAGRWKVYENGRILVFASPASGSYRITLSVAVGDQSDLTAIVLKNGVGPDPDPDPDPGPDPIPPDGRWAVVIVYESNDLDEMPEDQVSIVKGLDFRERLAKAGHQLVPGGIFDKDGVDRTGKTPKALVPYLAACKDKTLPRLCMSPIDGGTIRTFALPENADEVLKQLEGKP